jgi:hypothetical protein
MATDAQAIERYRYMLRTAPPDDVERAHAEAFASLTPEQRRSVLERLSAEVPPSEVPRSDDPASLARLATRAEIRQPGTMERAFGAGAMPGLGGMFMSTLAGAFIGSSIAHAFFANDTGYEEGYSQGYQEGQGTDQGGTEAGADSDVGEAGSDAGGWSDFGGGDFGGGDFGGGDI